MAITITNMNTLSLLNILNRTSANQSNTLTRLSTGSRINSGKDDPAGLIAMRSLELELTAVDASISNNQRTDSMLNVADKALTEVSGLLDEIKSLAVASASEDGISAEELNANQAQIDQAIDAIDRIIGTTSFNGKSLLDGSLGINVSGVDNTKISDLHVYSRNQGSDETLSVDVTATATQASATAATNSATAATTLEIRGKDGAVIIEVAAGENLSAVEAKIDASAAQTGVTASASGGNLSLISSAYGDDAFVQITVLSGDSTNYTASDRQVGTDASVTVNGQSAAVDGLKVNYNSNNVSATFNLTTEYGATGTVTGLESFVISGSTGGATFQLGTTSDTRSTIGIDGMYSAKLGSGSLGYLSSLRSGGANSMVDDPNQAAQIASEAASQLASVQGRVGGFLKFQVGSALNQQTATRESLTAALSTIKDVDYATETANLSQQNVLMQAAMSLLGLANQQSSQVLSLLM